MFKVGDKVIYKEYPQEGIRTIVNILDGHYLIQYPSKSHFKVLFHWAHDKLKLANSEIIRERLGVK